MTTVLASQELSRSLRRRGALVTGLFAFVWAAAGSLVIVNATARTIILVGAVVVTVAAVVLARRVDSTQVPDRPRRLPANWRQRFNRISVVQFAAIGLAVTIPVSIGQTTPVPFVVCLIVGFHFFPLAPLFDQPQYLWTGALLCAVAGLGSVALIDDNARGLAAIVGIGGAIVLWGTSFHIARRG